MNRHLLLWLSLLLPWLIVAFEPGIFGSEEVTVEPRSEQRVDLNLAVPLFVAEHEDHVMVTWIDPQSQLDDQEISHFEVERTDSAGTYFLVGGMHALMSEDVFDFQDMFQHKPESPIRYRIKICLPDGSFDYSREAVFVPKRQHQLEAIPSHNTHVYTISLSQPMTGTLRVLNANGQFLSEQPWSGKQQQLSLEGYSAGLYLVQVSNGLYTAQTKVVVH